MAWQAPAPAPPKRRCYDLTTLNDVALVDTEARCLQMAAWWTDRATEARDERTRRLQGDLFEEVRA